MLLLKDPRQYSTAYPDSNILISQALHDLGSNESGELIQALIEDLLNKAQDQIISVAYNLAPSQEVADYIWQHLQLVLTNSALSPAPHLFAIPLIIIVGSTTEISLNTKIDEQKVSQLFCDKDIFQDPKHSFINGNLFDIEGLVKLKLSQLYKWNNSLTKADDWDLSGFSSSPITNLGEGVYLRFLLGITFSSDKESHAITDNSFGKFGMELVQIILNDLKTSGATIFPLPFPICHLSKAAALGEHHRKEISIAVALSQIVKKMRLDGNEPQIKLFTNNNNIHIEVYSLDTNICENLVWTLQRTDDFAEISKILYNLFNDMQLSVSYS